jgi:putative tryptophan/tyrosine transport system substrate-binding protein
MTAVQRARPIMRRITALVALVFLGSLNSPPSTGAEAIKTFRVELAAFANPRSPPFHVAFEDRLRELGYIEGKNLTVDFFTANGDEQRLPPALREFAGRHPDVIVAGGSETTLKAAMEATKTIPIVMVAVDYDPLARGYVASLPHPGGNITGVFLRQTELSGKRLDLLKQTIPDVARVIVFWDATSADQLQALKRAAESLKLTLELIELRNRPYDYASSLESVHPRPGDALYFTASGLFLRDRDRIADLLARFKLPAVVGGSWIHTAGLFSYQPSTVDMYRLGADYVDKILKGTLPAELPIEQPTKFELIVNLKTAKALGLTVPQTIFARADEVIE